LPTIRRQLSLYVPAPEATALESVRRVLDPVQSDLIPAHVTLCREDELALVEPGVLKTRLLELPVRPLTLHFGRAEAFHEHGILLPCIAGEEDFRLLREHVLGSRTIRRQTPHITLAHPRNPKAVGNCLANASVLPEVVAVTFMSIRLVEQADATTWRELECFEFPGIS
jgi:hypothetical protein